MSDIVERLRNISGGIGEVLSKEDAMMIMQNCKDAADEIEKLRNAPIDQKLQWRLDEIIERLRNAGL